MTADLVGNPVSLRIAADPEELPKAREALRGVMDRVGFDTDAEGKIVLAIDEALANVIKHGYGGACAQPIDVSFAEVEKDGRRGLRVEIRDFGRQVEPSEICGRDLDDVRPGGLGVHIMRTVMDEVEFAHAEDCGMRLTMVKWVT